MPDRVIITIIASKHLLYSANPAHNGIIPCQQHLAETIAKSDHSLVELSHTAPYFLLELCDPSIPILAMLAMHHFHCLLSFLSILRFNGRHCLLAFCRFPFTNLTCNRAAFIDELILISFLLYKTTSNFHPSAQLIISKGCLLIPRIAFLVPVSVSPLCHFLCSFMPVSTLSAILPVNLSCVRPMLARKLAKYLFLDRKVCAAAIVGKAVTRPGA